LGKEGETNCLTYILTRGERDERWRR